MKNDTLGLWKERMQTTENEYWINPEEYHEIVQHLLESNRVLLSMDEETYEILIEDCIATGG